MDGLRWLLLRRLWRLLMQPAELENAVGTRSLLLLELVLHLLLHVLP